MSGAPGSGALLIHLQAMGCVSATLLPMIRMASLLAMSIQWLVMAPRPKLAARPATVGEGHIRAWCSRETTPRARANFEIR